MSTTWARLLLGFFIAGMWLVLLSAVAMADTCKERADAITAGRAPANQPDPDCERANVIGTTLAVAAGATAVGVTAVRLGLGAASAGPVVQATYGGAAAIDILIKSGLVNR